MRIIIIFSFFLSIISCNNIVKNDEKVDVKKIDSNTFTWNISEKLSNDMYMLNQDIKFKKWCKDTLDILKKDNSYKKTEIGVISRKIILNPDSTFFEIRYRISLKIYPQKKYSINTIVGSVIYNLKWENVILPKTKYELRIEYAEEFGMSGAEHLTYEMWPRYDYISTRPINSNIETCYSIIKGNLIDTKEQVFDPNWEKEYDPD
jgi:hypothetical protein